MTADVISLDAHRPHLTGRARCLSCRHEWEAVALVGAVWLECPRCSLMHGAFVGHFYQPSDVEWACGCGCTLFQLLPSGAYCPLCGTRQRWEPES